jgi:hypothetical protein
MTPQELQALVAQLINASKPDAKLLAQLLTAQMKSGAAAKQPKLKPAETRSMFDTKPEQVSLGLTSEVSK